MNAPPVPATTTAAEINPDLVDNEFPTGDDLVLR
jgi:hypothetical protein